MLDPVEVALRDAILAVLRDRPVAQTADALVPVLPRRVRLMTGTPTGFCADHHARLRGHPEIRLLDCRGTRGHLVSELPSANLVLHHLAALHSFGYVQRFPGEKGGPATWIWVEPQMVPDRWLEADTARQCEEILAFSGISDGGEL